jgi:hypothetical protein
MGHYRADMCCDKCGVYICECVPKMDKDKDEEIVFVIDNYKVVRSDKYIKQHKHKFGWFITYMRLKHYKTEQEAIDSLDNVLFEDILVAENKIKELQEIRKNLPKR